MSHWNQKPEIVDGGLTLDRPVCPTCGANADAVDELQRVTTRLVWNGEFYDYDVGNRDYDDIWLEEDPDHKIRVYCPDDSCEQRSWTTSCREQRNRGALDAAPAGFAVLDAASAHGLTEGTRVRLISDVERFPHFIAKAGMTGYVREIRPDFLAVKIDQPLENCEEWENEVWWSDDAVADIARRSPRCATHGTCTARSNSRSRVSRRRWTT